MDVKSKHTGKNNPSKNPAFSKKEGLSGIEDLDPRVTVVKETASVIPWLIKFAVVGITVYVIYRSYTNRFVKWKENSSFPQSNITLAEAQSRADAIDQAVGVFSGDFDTIKSAFQNVNYNAIVRIYNAFGNRKSTLLGREMNLVEWLRDRLNDYQWQEIGFITSGVIGG